MFLGYSNLHKGFKCLDPTAGRVYVSRNVIYDEHVFPFSLLHPNASARLRAELALLPDVLRNPSSHFRDAILRDQSLVNSTPTNVVSSSPTAMDVTGSNLVKNGEETGANDRHFMWHGSGDRNVARIEDDPPAPASGSAAPSSLGSLSPVRPCQSVSGSGSAAPQVSSTPALVTGAAVQPDLNAGGRPHEISRPDPVQMVCQWCLMLLQRLKHIL